MKKTALVSGANRGIGFAIAKGLIAHGLDVWLGARDASAGAAAAAEIGAKPVTLDVADPVSVRAAVEIIGAVDVLVNNAGVMGYKPVLEDADAFRNAMAVMVEGPFLLMHLLAPKMVAAGYGRIVNVSSDWGSFSRGIEGQGGYGVAKAALNALTVAAAKSLPDCVKVNCMCPGWTITRMGGPDAAHNPAAHSAEAGADTAIWLATLGADGPNGGFFRARQPHAW